MRGRSGWIAYCAMGMTADFESVFEVIQGRACYGIACQTATYGITQLTCIGVVAPDLRPLRPAVPTSQAIRKKEQIYLDLHIHGENKKQQVLISVRSPAIPSSWTALSVPVQPQHLLWRLSG